MGDILQVSCDLCRYNKEFRVGTGLIYGELSHYLITSLIPGKAMQDDLLRLLEGPTGRNLCRDQLYRCPKCGTLSSRFYAEVHHPRGVYRTRYHCHRCNKTLEPLMVEAIGEEPCPRCREGRLHHQVQGTWD